MSMESPQTVRDTGSRDLLDALSTDTTREAFERESRLLWSAEADRVDVHTAERSLMRRFLSHPEFRLRWMEVRRGDRGSRSVEADDLATEWNGEDVLSINGSIPLGCVTVKASPRSTGGHAAVVTRSVLSDE
jgi:hypothetical protein